MTIVRVEYEYPRNETKGGSGMPPLTAEADRARMIDDKRPYTTNMLSFNANDRINALLDEGRVREARNGAERILARVESKFGPDHQDTLTALNTLGALELLDGDPLGAKQLLLRAFAGRKKVLGLDSPKTVASAINLGRALSDNLDYEGALGCHRLVLEFRERTLPEGHPGIGSSLIEIGLALNGLGEYAKAEEAFSRAAGIVDKLPLGSPDVTTAMLGLAKTMIATDRYESALPLLTRARENIRRCRCPDPYESEKLCSMLGDALKFTGDLLGSRDALREAWEIAKRNHGPETVGAYSSQLNLGAALAATGEFAESVRHLEKAVAGLKRGLGPGHGFIVMAQGLLDSAHSMYWIAEREVMEYLEPGRAAGDIVRDLKRVGVPERMRNHFLGVYWLDPKQGGPGVPGLPEREAMVARFGNDASGIHGAPGMSVDGARALWEARERELGPGNEDTLRACVALGNALVWELRMDEAEEIYSLARDAAARSFGPRSLAAHGVGLCLRTLEILRVEILKR
jgi:tetratricopeptide (TPR) repeat protein